MLFDKLPTSMGKGESFQLFIEGVHDTFSLDLYYKLRVLLCLESPKALDSKNP